MVEAISEQDAGHVARTSAGVLFGSGVSAPVGALVAIGAIVGVGMGALENVEHFSKFSWVDWLCLSSSHTSYYISSSFLLWYFLKVS